jgi:putative OPT family oligopeptide transporter
MCISASIPAAVLSLLIMRTLLKRGSLLESNMVQTVGSAGESLAAGMIFTIPALFIIGKDPTYLEMIIWGGIGGLMGVCFMVPLRHVLIVKEHGNLPYPEGVACAEVLQSGERGAEGAWSVIWGTIVGGVFYLLAGLGLFPEQGRISIRPLRTEFQLDASPALLGVGYILGVRVAAYMLAGALLAWFVLVPGIAFFGENVDAAVFPATAERIADMSPGDIWSNYLRYIGAGAVAVGGLISLLKGLPTIVASSWHLLGGTFRPGGGSKARTARDFPFGLLLLILLGLAYAMWKIEAVRVDHIGVIAVVVCTFFFVTVSSRLVGIVGQSSNPISGMTIATLLGTALVYKLFVMDAAAEYSEDEMTGLKVACLSVGAIVCIGISIAGDTSQDLKTGFLVKATPYKQQVGEMIGVITSVLVLAGVILLLNKAYGFSEPTPEKPTPLPAYQANIMKIIVEGVLGGQVPWTLIAMGGAAAVVVELLGLPALPFAVGMYLPLGLSTPIMVGGVVRWLIDRKRRQSVEHDPGVLTASGLVAGKGLMGVVLAGTAALVGWGASDTLWRNPLSGQEEAVVPSHLGPYLWERIGWLPRCWGLSRGWWAALPIFPFAALTIWLWWCARKRPAISLPPTPDRPESGGPEDPGTNGSDAGPVDVDAEEGP